MTAVNFSVLLPLSDLLETSNEFELEVNNGDVAGTEPEPAEEKDENLSQPFDEGIH